MRINRSNAQAQRKQAQGEREPFFNNSPAGPSMFDGVHKHKFTLKWAPGAWRVKQTGLITGPAFYLHPKHLPRPRF